MAIEPVNERPIFPALIRADRDGVAMWSMGMVRQLTTVFQQYGYRLNAALLEEMLAAEGGTIPETDRINTFGASQIINGHLTLGPVGGEGGEIRFAPDTLAGEFIIDVFGETARFRVEGSPLGWDFHYNIGSIAASGLSQQGQGTINARGLFTNAPVILNGESWTAPTLQNGWVNYGGAYATAGFRKTAAGMVVVKGLIKNGTTTAGTVLFTLPVGYRPAERHIITTTSGNAWARIDVQATGTVIVQAGVVAAWVAINFTFYAEQ